MAAEGMKTSSVAIKHDGDKRVANNEASLLPEATHLQNHTAAAPSLEDSVNGVAGPKHKRSKSAPANTFKFLVKDATPQFTQVPSLNKRLKIDRHISNISHAEEGRHSAVLVLEGGRHASKLEAKELVEEISFLEGEIADLEQYVLTLYRSLFNKCVSPSPSALSRKYKSTILDQRKEITSPQEDCSPKHSTKTKLPYQHRNNTMQISSNVKIIASAVNAKTRHAPKLCESVEVEQHCQVLVAQSPQQVKPPSEPKISRSVFPVDVEDSSPRMLKDYLSESPNQLSEDLVRCMANVYCKLSISPPASSSGAPESPLSSTSSLTSASSIHGVFSSDGWSPASHPEPATYDSSFTDSFHVKKSYQWTAAYHDMIEIPYICTDKDRLTNATRMLRTFRSLVEKLERADPSQLKHNQKLAFWINIYNALIMHAYVAYGIPRNNLKRMSVLQKASYKVGGQTITAHIVEHYFLRCNFHRPSQWLQNLLSPSMKLKSGSGRRAFAIDKAEPLVCFALCCGSRSDPAMRVYTAKHVHEELDTSMKEYLQASIGFQSGKKILLPKVLEWYMKESSLASHCLLDWVAQYVNEQDRESIRRCVHSKPHKSTTHCIDWVPYNLGFRYILSRELVSRTPSSGIQ